MSTSSLFSSGSLPEHVPPLSLCCYMALCSIGVGSTSILTITLWSSVGFGHSCLDALQDYEAYWQYTCGGSFIIIFVLYLLDCFYPPHLPDQRLALFRGDRVVARTFFAIAVILMIATCYFQADEYPSVPLVSSIMLGPISVGVIRLIRGSSQASTYKVIAIMYGQSKSFSSSRVDEPDPMSPAVPESAGKKTEARAKNALEIMAEDEEDLLNFYKATAWTFMLWSTIVLIGWIFWIHSVDGADFQSLHSKSEAKKEEAYIIWSTPLVLGISNLFFGLLAIFRVRMHRTYMDYERAGSMNSTSSEDQLFSRSFMQLTLAVKVLGCSFILLLGLLYVVGQLLYADSQIATMVMVILGCFFIAFVVLTYVSFRGVAVNMARWIRDLPAWKTLLAALRSNWVRALVLCCLLPLIPWVLLISALNQQMRRLRSLYDYFPQPQRRAAVFNPGSKNLAGEGIVRSESGTSKGSKRSNSSLESLLSCQSYGDPDFLRTRWLTPKVDRTFTQFQNWDWIEVIIRCYIMCLGYVIITLCPMFLNVSLVWMSTFFANWPFYVIVLGTFGIGFVAFLLPPVPGMTIYIFGGLVITQNCKIGGNGDYQFWIGTTINILVGWFLKLVACAVQQKCIGGMLGNSLWVKATVGVHKVAIRCVEAILRQPGFSVGKLAILCGGPDWPTSVMAGILKLSLVQCELGTLPIIGFIAPCALSGSFYLKRQDSPLWRRIANMMILASVFVNFLLWAIVAWAIQNELTNNYVELVRPLPQHVELHWRDYREAEIAKTASVHWDIVPCAIRFMYVLGALTHIFICQGLYYGYYYMFGFFEITDKIEDLVWYGNNGLVTSMGAIVLCVYCVAWCGFFLFLAWRQLVTRGPRNAAVKYLKDQEAMWKADWLEKAKVWEPPLPPPTPSELRQRKKLEEGIKDTPSASLNEDHRNGHHAQVDEEQNGLLMQANPPKEDFAPQRIFETNEECDWCVSSSNGDEARHHIAVRHRTSILLVQRCGPRIGAPASLVRAKKGEPARAS